MNYGIQSGKNVPDFPKRNRGFITSILVASFIVGVLLAFLKMIDGNREAMRQDDEFRTWAKGKQVR